MTSSYHNPPIPPAHTPAFHNPPSRPAVAGILAGAAGLGLGELLAALIGPIRSPLLAVADRVVDLSPTGVREWAISTL
ncbi:MAG: hypothetical protein WAW08_02385, partial [Candidatus Microthrix parvicella]